MVVFVSLLNSSVSSLLLPMSMGYFNHEVETLFSKWIGKILAVNKIFLSLNCHLLQEAFRLSPGRGSDSLLCAPERFEQSL